MSTPHKRVTSSDVARHAGVSRSTVSFVLNGVRLSNISDATRKRVFASAEQLGYVPNAAARALAGGKSGTIGLVIRPLRMASIDVFLQSQIHSLLEVCLENGYRLLFDTADTVSTADDLDQVVRSDQIDALVVVGVADSDPVLRNLINSGFPVVIVGSDPLPKASSVGTIDYEGTFRTTSHLISLGHRDIAFVHYAPLVDEDKNSRPILFKRAMAEAGLEIRPNRMFSGNFGASGGYDAMQYVLNLDSLPTAVVAGNDTAAIGVLSAIQEHGLRVPDDIAVVGHDDIPNARFTSPALTTLHQPIRAMGRAAGELAIAAINDPGGGPRYRGFPSKLIVRHSCGAIPLTTPLANSTP